MREASYGSNVLLFFIKKSLWIIQRLFFMKKLTHFTTLNTPCISAEWPGKVQTNW